MRPARRLRPGEQVEFAVRDGSGNAVARATVIEKVDDGQGIVDLDEYLARHLDAYGQVPLPPYIQTRLEDDERYQTVYSRAEGSAAAPTAGLHFTPEILTRLNAQGVNLGRVTLHVVLDTFRPVTAEF